MYIDEKPRKIIFLLSILFSVIFLAILLHSGSYYPTSPYWIPIQTETNNLIAYSILLAILPTSIIEFLNNRWLEDVEKNIPRILNDVTEEVKSGQSLIN